MSDAIPASTVRVSTMADGTLRLTLDVEPAHAQAAFALFGRPGQPAALAALKTAGQQQTERAKGGSAAKWLGMRCAEPAFQVWLEHQFPDFVPIRRGQFGSVDLAAMIARSVCGVQSRAEIDNDPAAFERFDRLIRRPWLEHTGGTA